MTPLYETPGYDQRPCRHVPTALFFTPEDARSGGHNAYPAEAIAACNACPPRLRAACLDDSLAVSDLFDQGYRAGLTQRQRRRIRERRRRGAA